MGEREINSNPSRCLVGGAVLDGFRAALIEATLSFGLLMASFQRQKFGRSRNFDCLCREERKLNVTWKLKLDEIEKRKSCAEIRANEKNEVKKTTTILFSKEKQFS